MDQIGWQTTEVIPDLCKASREGDSTLVKLLLANGASREADKYGSTPLHFAASNGNEEIVLLLLIAGADPNAVNQVGSTPLHSAAAYNHNGVIELLVNAGADLDASDCYGWTPLHEAACTGPKTITQLLYPTVSRIDTYLSSKPTNGEVGTCVPTRLRRIGANPTLTNKKGETPSQLTPSLVRPEDRVLLKNAEYIWTHSWSDQEHARWPEDQRLEQVAALSAFKYQPKRRSLLPELPKELQYAIFEFL